MRRSLIRPIQSSSIIAAPAMTVWAGTRKVEDFEATRELLPRWQAVQVQGTGHFLMMEKPDAFNALLKAFLDNRAEY